jgi:hypothetical protein
MASWRQVTHVPVHSGCCILLARIYRPIGLLDGSLHLGCRIFKGVRYSVKLQLVQDSIYCVAPPHIPAFPAAGKNSVPLDCCSSTGAPRTSDSSGRNDGSERLSGECLRHYPFDGQRAHLG